MDGGRFLRFDAPETGFRAALTLLTTRLYRDLTLEQALRRWSNGGFGAEILAGTRLDARQSIWHLGPDDFAVLLVAMATAEGYRSMTVVDEVRKGLNPAAGGR